jgi:hypothetical protein
MWDKRAKLGRYARAEEYRSGFKARMNGAGVYANPNFLSASTNKSSWQRGWEDADAKVRERKEPKS